MKRNGGDLDQVNIKSTHARKLVSTPSEFCLRQLRQHGQRGEPRLRDPWNTLNSGGVAGNLTQAPHRDSDAAVYFEGVSFVQFYVGRAGVETVKRSAIYVILSSTKITCTLDIAVRDTGIAHCSSQTRRSAIVNSVRSVRAEAGGSGDGFGE